jgi:hypothetical protein
MQLICTWLLCIQLKVSLQKNIPFKGGFIWDITEMLFWNLAKSKRNTTTQNVQNHLENKEYGLLINNGEVQGSFVTMAAHTISANRSASWFIWSRRLCVQICYSPFLCLLLDRCFLIRWSKKCWCSWCTGWVGAGDMLPPPLHDQRTALEILPWNRQRKKYNSRRRPEIHIVSTHKQTRSRPHTRQTASPCQSNATAKRIDSC